jgi:hypothetical protein
MTTQTETAPKPDTTYNGWTNYETWLLGLWIDNEESSSTYWNGRGREAFDSAAGSCSAYAKFTGREIFTQRERAAIALADDLKTDFEEASCNMLEEAGHSASFWADLIGAALSEVNWREVAEHYLPEEA